LKATDHREVEDAGERLISAISVPKTERKPDHRQEPPKQASDRSKNCVRVFLFLKYFFKVVTARTVGFALYSTTCQGN